MTTLAVHVLRQLLGRRADPLRIRQLERELGFYARPSLVKPSLAVTGCACHRHYEAGLAPRGICTRCSEIYGHACPLRSVDLTVKEAS